MSHLPPSIRSTRDHTVSVLTDHDNLKHSMTMKVPKGRHIHWAEQLAAFNFYIKHFPGTENPADAPSRVWSCMGVTSALVRAVLVLEVISAEIDRPHTQAGDHRKPKRL